MLIKLKEGLKSSIIYYREMICQPDQNPQTFTLIYISTVLVMIWALLQIVITKSVPFRTQEFNLPKTTAAYFFPDFFHSYTDDLKKEMDRFKGVKIYSEPTLYPFFKDSQFNDLDHIDLKSPPKYLFQYLSNFYDPKNLNSLHKTLDSEFYFQRARVQVYTLDKIKKNDKAFDAQE